MCARVMRKTGKGLLREVKGFQSRPGVSQRNSHIVQRAYFTPVEQKRVFAHNYKHESLPTVHVSGG